MRIYQKEFKIKRALAIVCYHYVTILLSLLSTCCHLLSAAFI